MSDEHVNDPILADVMEIELEVGIRLLVVLCARKRGCDACACARVRVKEGLGVRNGLLRKRFCDEDDDEMRSELESVFRRYVLSAYQPGGILLRTCSVTSEKLPERAACLARMVVPRAIRA